MSVSFSEPDLIERIRSRKMLNLLVVANIAFAAAMLVFWTTTGVFVEAPWAWGTSANVGRVGSWQSYFAYPYVLLWGLPLGSSLAARLTLGAGNHKLATLLAMLPLMLFALTFVIYHFAPLEWR